MIDLENFTEHLKTLTIKDWNKLFNLIPAIEKNENFGEIIPNEELIDSSFTFPHWNTSEIFDITYNVIIDLKLNPVFDWVNWETGKSILKDSNFNYSELDTISLCKLLTTIIRADRFNEGYMISCFRKGMITKIIKGLQRNVKISI